MRAQTEKAYQYIKHQINSQNWYPEMHLFETAIAKELQMSRTPIREAFTQLEMEGLLQRTLNKGVQVARLPLNRREVLDRLQVFEFLLTEHFYYLEKKAMALPGALLQQIDALQHDNRAEFSLQHLLQELLSLANNRFLAETILSILNSLAKLYQQLTQITQQKLQHTLEVGLPDCLSTLRQEDYRHLQHQFHLLMNQIELVVVQQL